MYKRIGSCRRCGRCCRSFNLLAGAMSNFKRAQEKYGLKLIPNSNSKTFRCSMLTEDNLCKIHYDKPKVCKEAPRISFPKEWDCGYEFICIDTKQKDIKKTKKALRFFEELPKIENIDEHTKQIIEEGRRCELT